MQIAAKKFGGKKPEPLWKQKAPPIGFKSPAVPPGFQTVQTTQKAKPIVQKQPSLGVKAQLLGYNRLLRDIYNKPARFSSILHAHGVAQADTQVFLGSPAKVAKFLEIMSVSLSQPLAKKHGDIAFSVLDNWYGLKHARQQSAKAVSRHSGLTPAQTQLLHAASLATLRGLAKNGTLREQVLSAYEQGK